MIRRLANAVKEREVWVAGRGYGGAGGERLQVVL